MKVLRLVFERLSYIMLSMIAIMIEVIQNIINENLSCHLMRN